MLRILLPACLLLLPQLSRAESAPSFLREVLPTLTRAGCSSGACHGSPNGKNGFRLSLRGYDPALDIFTMTHEANGRRLDRLRPEASLLLQKGTGTVAHEGGKRLDPLDPGYTILKNWIAAGAVDDRNTSPALKQLTITPGDSILEANVAEVTLKVEAEFSDGSRQDVTHLSRFSSSDDTLASVSITGRIKRLQTGESGISAEYMNRMATVRIAFLPPAAGFQWKQPLSNNFIDDLAFARLKQLRIAPSELCSDTVFLRRSCLDTLGRLPTAEEIRNFLADPSPQKRNAWIEQMLTKPEFAAFRALKWADRLGCNQRFVGKIGALKYHEWIRQQMADNVPEDEFVRKILTASGQSYSSPPASFWRRLRDPEMRAEEVAQLFMGVRMQCARCHNHPGESWTQNDYHALAAFFPRMEYRSGPFFIDIYNKEETVLVSRQGEWNHPRTGVVVAPKFPGSTTPMTEEDRRAAFANWLTGPENPWFAKASVNRIWFQFFGRGIVDPVDDLRSTNPASLPEVLDALTTDFVKHGFDRKNLIRKILQSRLYQLDWRTTTSNAGDESCFSHAKIRPLPAEVLLDAISQATGVSEKFTSFPLGLRAVGLPDGEYKHAFLEVFNRPARAMSCECERGSEMTLSQALHLTGGQFSELKVNSDDGRIAKLLAAKATDSVIIDELFLATLSRLPTTEERSGLEKRFGGSKNRRQTAEDLLWALLNHREFLFQR